MGVALVVGRGEAGGRITGHAIAAHATGSGEFYLFDPNLGIFRCHNRDAFRRTLAALVGPVWAEMGWQLSGDFGYAVFRAGQTVSDTKGHEKPVDYTSDSNHTTTVRNQKIGTIPTVVPTGGVKSPAPKPTVQRKGVLLPKGTIGKRQRYGDPHSPSRWEGIGRDKMAGLRGKFGN